MSCKMVLFDNDYRLYLDREYLSDPEGKCIAGFCNLVREFPINLKELSDEQLWLLCEPIIQAYELGVETAEKKMAEKIIKIFDLKTNSD